MIDPDPGAGDRPRHGRQALHPAQSAEGSLAAALEAILVVGGVREAAVGPVSDPLHYQVAAALLVIEGDADAVVRSIKQHLRDTLSRAKAPRQYFVVADIPRTPAGKFDRVAIAASLQELALRP